MYVDDACEALFLLMDRGTPGVVYNLGPAGQRFTNLEIARAVATAAGRDEDCIYLTAYDRPQHDRAYAVDSTRLKLLGWAPRFALDVAMKATVEWYRENREWWTPLRAEAETLYDDEAPRRQ
jgi:dTDP-glucose 4,6-dehydratase